jgi:4-amino-4-deoxy-L-arabinose transferase-like glycosyltransferase
MKSKIKQFFLANLSIILSLFLFLGISLALFNYYRYQLGPDGLSYLSIANKYLAGNFKDAINGYWAPLISWLLVPFIALKISGLSAFLMLTIFSGLLVIIASFLLISRFNINQTIKIIIIFTLIPIVISFSLIIRSPDILMLALALFYLNIIFDPEYPNKKWAGILAGLLGALAYFSKHYAFFFFIFHFPLFNLFQYLANQKRFKKIIFNFISGMIVFLVLSSFWFIPVSLKYERLTIGTTGQFNYRLVGPESTGNPIKYHGLIKPANETAVSAWEDPLPSTLKSWSPFSSRVNFQRQLKIIWRNTKKMAGSYNQFTIFLAPIMLAFLILLSQSGRKIFQVRQLLYPFITLLLFSAGYSLISLETRLLWLTNILLLIMAGYLLTLLMKNQLLTKVGLSILILAISISFVFTPIKNLIDNYDAGKFSYQTAQILKNYQIKGNLASNGHSWPNTLAIAYFLDSKFYSAVPPNISDADLKKQLQKYPIDYYFVWKNLDDNIRFLSHYPEVTNGQFSDLRIYKISHNH